MTYEEALNHAKKEQEAYLHKVADGKAFYAKYAEFWRIVVKAIEKQIKYRWHDLRKNPEDLPAGTDSVLVCYQHLHPDLRCYECAYYEDGAWIDNAETWKNDVDFAGDWEVIAWRYVEQFEEFEE